MMREQGSLAIIVAPIVAHGHFYGVLIDQRASSGPSGSGRRPT